MNAAPARPPAPVPPLEPPSPRAVAWMRGVAAAGGAAFLAGLFLAPARVWPNFLLAVVLLAGLGLSGAVFLALHYVTGARWSVGIRRVPEAMTSALPWAGLLTVALAFGAPTLYAWADESAVTGDRILEARAGWMNVPFVLGRALAAFAAWTGLAALLVRRSRRQDEDGDPAHRARNVRTSAVFLVVFGGTFSVACFDWLMSLERHWFSTIYAVYHFSGLFLSGLAALTLLVVFLRRRGVLRRAADDEVLHDLGKLLFGFSLFWGYIWFSQYMLIWYANNPEETTHYVARHAGAWAPLAAANVLLNWTVPFVVLLPRAAKRSETVLVRVCIVLLVGRWLDLYLAIVQPSSGAEPTPTPWDLLLPAGAGAAFLLLWWRAMGRAPAVPAGEGVAAEAGGHA